MKDRNLSRNNQPEHNILQSNELAKKKKILKKKKHNNKKYWIDQAEDEAINDEELIDFLKFREEEE